MRLAPIVPILAFVSICPACASKTTGDNEVGMLAKLLERRGQDEPSPGPDSLASDLSQFMQNGRTSASSVKKKRAGPDPFVDILPARGPSLRVAVHPDGSHCNDNAKSARAWERRLSQVSYGGETVYPVLQVIYGQPVILKKIVITEANRMAKHKELTIIEKVKQLVDWGVAKEGEREIWIVIQEFFGVPERDVMHIDKPVEGKPINFEWLRQYARHHYETHFHVKLPAATSDDKERYRFRKFVVKKTEAAGAEVAPLSHGGGDLGSFRSSPHSAPASAAANQEKEWRCRIVGWEGAEFIPRFSLVPRTKRVPISPDSRGSTVAKAWQRRVEKSITYGGEVAYAIPDAVYNGKRMVIKTIVINKDADEIAAGELVVILQRVDQLKEYGILQLSDGRTMWVLVQKSLGFHGSRVNGISQVDLLRLRNNARDTYVEDYNLALPDNEIHNTERYRYMVKDGQWIAIIVGWRGGKVVPPVLKMKPEKLCMHSVEL
ncbi:hypothetical protein APHAL10511_005519 [Amanita phalloides]|nr:hypothetical protein APHAL10511_005519 [Amanita phalloides]